MLTQARASAALLLGTALFFAVPTYAAALPDAFPVQPGIASLVLATTDSELEAVLSAPAISLIGFESNPKTPSERNRFQLARQNLRKGDALLRFNTDAACSLMASKVRMGSPGKGRIFSAHYRFTCAEAAHLTSVAMGLFLAFPRLQHLFVRYEIAGLRGEAEANWSQPLISFIPLF